MCQTSFTDILNEKQQKIARLVSEGLKNKDIAVEVGTTEGTVKNYLRKIFDLAGMNNRTELALWYVAHFEAPQSVVVRGQKFCPSCGVELTS